MDLFGSYEFVIIASGTLILSYFFSLQSKRTRIPSVILLILLGIILNIIITLTGIEMVNLIPLLEVLGIVGLLLIVLEAALDLEINRYKTGIILRAFLLALITLLVSMLLIGVLLMKSLSMSFLSALLYAVPLSVVSSSIVIPSVAGLESGDREFMIYESTISDILGIIFFYFLAGITEQSNAFGILIRLPANILLTAAISLVVGYVLIYISQKIDTGGRIFLLIAVLLLMYSLGKILHLSALLIILVFGIMLRNRELFFSGWLRPFLDNEKASRIFHNFELVTLESSFVVRTFFFVIFGMTLVLSSLFVFKVLYISIIVLLIIYLTRFFFLHLFIREATGKLLFLSPRGLITILLFYSIPRHLQSEAFNQGILLYVILISSILMTISLFVRGRKEKKTAQNSLTGSEMYSQDNGIFGDRHM